jgi:hypothetical protein
VGGPRRRRQGPGVERGEPALGLVEMPYQEKASDLEVPRRRGIHPSAVRRQRCPRGVERRLQPGHIARDERHLRLGNDAPRAGDRLLWTEGTSRAPQERFRAAQIPELRHRDASKRKRGRVIAEGNPVQGAERIAGGEGPCGGRDQRVHPPSRSNSNIDAADTRPNPAPLVTPTSRGPTLNYLTAYSDRSTTAPPHELEPAAPATERQLRADTATARRRLGSFGAQGMPPDRMRKWREIRSSRWRHRGQPFGMHE